MAPPLRARRAVQQARAPLAVLLVAVAYAAVAVVGNRTTSLPGGMSPIFPSAGIGLAAALILGWPALIGIWIGSFAANSIIYAPTLYAVFHPQLKGEIIGCFVGIGAALAAWSGASLVRRVCRGDHPLGSAQNVLVLVTAGAFVSAAVSASIGNLTVSLAGVSPWGLFAYSWLTWFLGDAFGCVIVTPLILAWHQPSSGPARSWQLAEGAALGGATLVLGFLVFFRSWPFEYGLMPLLMWAAFRFGVRGTTSAAVVIALLATIGTSLGSSPFVRGTANASLLALHSFLGVTIFSALVLSGVLSERRSAGLALEDSERKVLANEERLRQAAQVSGTGIFDHDHRADTIYWSPEQRAHYGWGPDEPATLASFTSHVHPDDRAGIEAAIRRAHDPAGDGRLDVEHRIVRRDGELRWLATRSQTHFEGEGSARRPTRTVGASIDVTSRKRAQEERQQLENRLRQSQKLEAMGTLAGGIAHDFNNILAIILGSAEMARFDLAPGSDAARDVERIREASERAKELVAQILTFSRRTETRPVSCDVRPILKEALRFLRSSLPTSIEIREQVGAVGSVVVDPTQLHQVVMNLGTNAFHAMEERGGLLEVSMSEVKIGETDAARSGLAAGSYAKLTVSDTGTGIPTEARDRIFEPYFTTKEAGKGTGLGLATVHGIVTAAGGAVRVHSELGIGTTFDVYLPIAIGGAERPVASEAGPARGTERVLLVDDELMVVATQQKVLESLGYRVKAMTDSEAALAAFREDPQHFDLLVSDLTMPGLSGEALARAVLTVRPDLPVLLCSGFSDGVVAERVMALGVRGVLGKPVSRADFAREIRRALD
jgi:PAS domain S-box-containing protein